MKSHPVFSRSFPLVLGLGKSEKISELERDFVGDLSRAIFSIKVPDCDFCGCEFLGDLTAVSFFLPNCAFTVGTHFEFPFFFFAGVLFWG